MKNKVIKALKNVVSTKKEAPKKACTNCEDSGLECNSCGHRNA